MLEVVIGGLDVTEVVVVAAVVLGAVLVVVGASVPSGVLPYTSLPFLYIAIFSVLARVLVKPFLEKSLF